MDDTLTDLYELEQLFDAQNEDQLTLDEIDAIIKAILQKEVDAQ